MKMKYIIYRTWISIILMPVRPTSFESIFHRMLRLTLLLDLPAMLKVLLKRHLYTFHTRFCWAEVVCVTPNIVCANIV